MRLRFLWCFVLIFSFQNIVVTGSSTAGPRRGASFGKPRSAMKVAPRKAPPKRAPKKVPPKLGAKPPLKRANSLPLPKKQAFNPEPNPAMKTKQTFASPDTQFTNITSQKIGNVNGPQRPIVYSNNKNRLGQQKTYYRGVSNIKGFAGSSDKYVNDTFKNGMTSNYQIKKDVPGVRNMNKPPKTNVWAHQNKTAENSIFIATSKEKKVSQGFAGKKPGDGVFVIKPKNSKVINVNKTVPKEEGSIFRKEKEYVFTNKIPGNEISHFLKNGKDGKVEKVKNPYFKP